MTAPSRARRPVGPPRERSPYRRALLLTALLVPAGWVASDAPTPTGERAVQPPPPAADQNDPTDPTNVPGSVRIVYDAYGVPIVHAASFAEACFGVGYAHAEARAGQLYKQLYAALGRLAEVAGPVHGTQAITNLVGSDEFQRTLNLRDAMLQDYQLLPVELKDCMRNFAQGVNAYIESLDGDLPDVMKSFGFSPDNLKPWEPADSLLVYAFASNLFINNAYVKQLNQYQLFVSDVASTDFDTAVANHTYFGGPGTLRGILDCESAPVNNFDPAPGPTGAPAGPPPIHGRGPIAEVDEGRPLKASHGFAVPAALSSSGRPVVTAMPRISVQKSAWITWGVVTPDMRVRGAGFPGTIGMLTGFSRDVAWGVSAAPFNGDQVILIEPDPNDSTRYLLDGQSVPYTTRNEVIAVRGAPPVNLVVEETIFGPLIDDFISALPTDLNGTTRRVAVSHVIPLLHTANLVHPFAGFLDLMRADTLDEAMSAFAGGIHYPASLAYMADTQSGEVGFVSSGAAPKLGDDHPDPVEIRLQLPGDGRFSAAQWQGFETGFVLPNVKTAQDLIIVGNNLPRCPLELPGVYPGRAGHTERSSTLELELADVMAANGGTVSLLDARDMTRHCSVGLLVHLHGIVDYIVTNHPSYVPQGNPTIDIALTTLMNASLDLHSDNPDLCFLHNAFSKFATGFRTNPLGINEYGYGAAGAARFVRDFVADPVATINPADLPDIVDLVFFDGLEKGWNTTILPPNPSNPFKCGPDPALWINNNIDDLTFVKGSYFVTKEGELTSDPITTGFLPCVHVESLWSQIGDLYTLIAYPDLAGEFIGEVRFYPGICDDPASPRWDNTRADWEQGILRTTARDEAEVTARCGVLTKNAEICGYRDLQITPP